MDPGVVSSSSQFPLKPFKLGLGFQNFTTPSPSPCYPAFRSRFSLGWKLRSGSLELRGKPRALGRAVVASPRACGGKSLSPWDDKPYELLPTGRRAYLDEQDVVSFLDSPKELIPIDPASYNPAAYLWKKIGDIPEERRHRLIYTLKARHISRIWELAGQRYHDAKLAKQTASTLFSLEADSIMIEVWSGRTSKGPLPFAWLNDFNKVIFRAKDGGTYGRIIVGGSFPFGLANLYNPLYFRVRQVTEVMPTEQPCDVAYEFGDGLFDPQNFPKGFPKAGQAWQEGKDLEQVPQKFCGEILMLKDYTASG
ncbi:uncharacterized protein LOC103699427 isoform X2 [Phoenix dactylifera]|uniref:Uncharacterized protein LOC103699427 isoform X2 n=1 Tax=Phoenix dactylifera TaxID=42345 RepID=A0A8B7BKX1_PHODC|nr:uncharacterized protein LOC103699427 isoform X2 [Phoenix dactylifera]